MLLHLLGIAPLGAEVALTEVSRETAPAVKVADYAAAVAVDYGGRFLFHAEFLTWYRSVILEQMAEYGVSLALQHRLPVTSVLLLLRPDGAPRKVRKQGRVQIGGTVVTHPFRTVKIWKIDPSPILESNDVRLFPWAVLMKSTDAQVRQMAAALARVGDEESIGRFLSLGTIRYDKEELKEMVGGPKMGLVEAILEGSHMVREMTDKAREEGVAVGRAEGVRNVLIRILRERHPHLAELPELRSIDDVNALDRLIGLAYTSADDSQIEQAIRAQRT
jgi:hypothetical protein